MTPEHHQQETAPWWQIVAATIAVLGLTWILEWMENNGKETTKGTK